MKCERCGLELNEGEYYVLHGKCLCEDCCLYETDPPKCDPIAKSIALSVREQMGQLDSSGLTELQQKIYNTIDKHDKITKEELIEILRIKPEQLEIEMAFFGHCELLSAFRQDGKIYYKKR